MRRSDRVLSKLEHAGGYMTEAVSLLEEVPEAATLANKFVNINIALGDLRRSIVRVMNGEPIEEVARDLEKLQRELLG